MTSLSTLNAIFARSRSTDTSARPRSKAIWTSVLRVLKPAEAMLVTRVTRDFPASTRPCTTARPMAMAACVAYETRSTTASPMFAAAAATRRTKSAPAATVASRTWPRVLPRRSRNERDDLTEQVSGAGDERDQDLAHRPAEGDERGDDALDQREPEGDGLGEDVADLLADGDERLDGLVDEADGQPGDGREQLGQGAAQAVDRPEHLDDHRLSQLEGGHDDVPHRDADLLEPVEHRLEHLEGRLGELPDQLGKGGGGGVERVGEVLDGLDGPVDDVGDGVHERVDGVPERVDHGVHGIRDGVPHVLEELDHGVVEVGARQPHGVGPHHGTGLPQPPAHLLGGPLVDLAVLLEHERLHQGPSLGAGEQRDRLYDTATLALFAVSLDEGTAVRVVEPGDDLEELAGGPRWSSGWRRSHGPARPPGWGCGGRPRRRPAQPRPR